MAFLCYLAETVGFEPTDGVTVKRFRVVLVMTTSIRLQVLLIHYIRIRGKGQGICAVFGEKNRVGAGEA